MTNPVSILAKLEEIERDMAERQPAYERAAQRWYHAKREQGRDYARALISSNADSVTEKKAHADLAAYETEGAESEAEFEATRAVLNVLDKRAMILMAILKAQGRA